MKELKLFKHQKRALQKTENREYYAYFFEPGLGKTCTAILDYDKYNLDVVVVIMPNGLQKNWGIEVDKWTKIDNVQYTWNSITTKKNLNAQQEFIDSKSE